VEKATTCGQRARRVRTECIYLQMSSAPVVVAKGVSHVRVYVPTTRKYINIHAATVVGKNEQSPCGGLDHEIGSFNLAENSKFGSRHWPMAASRESIYYVLCVRHSRNPRKDDHFPPFEQRAPNQFEPPTPPPPRY
jgi:hypothetical protein